jgi:hypothetical protein
VFIDTSGTTEAINLAEVQAFNKDGALIQPAGAEMYSWYVEPVVGQAHAAEQCIDRITAGPLNFCHSAGWGPEEYLRVDYEADISTLGKVVITNRLDDEPGYYANGYYYDPEDPNGFWDRIVDANVHVTPGRAASNTDAQASALWTSTINSVQATHTFEIDKVLVCDTADCPGAPSLSNPGAVKCLNACPAGSYGTESPDCTSCPFKPSPTFAPEGSATIEDCTLCDTPGTYVCESGRSNSYWYQYPRSNACHPRYTYSRGCYECDAGYHNPLTTSTSADACQTCAAGKFSSPDRSSCSDCAAGSHSASAAPSCSLCLPGTFNPNSASTGPESCQDCAPDKTSMTGSANQDSCFPTPIILYNLFALSTSGEIFTYSKQSGDFVWSGGEENFGALPASSVKLNATFLVDVEVEDNPEVNMCAGAQGKPRHHNTITPDL